jgi:hypothetical protein
MRFRHAGADFWLLALLEPPANTPAGVFPPLVGRRWKRKEQPADRLPAVYLLDVYSRNASWAGGVDSGAHPNTGIETSPAPMARPKVKAMFTAADRTCRCRAEGLAPACEPSWRQELVSCLPGHVRAVSHVSARCLSCTRHHSSK